MKLSNEERRRRADRLRAVNAKRAAERAERVKETSEAVETGYITSGEPVREAEKK